MTRTLYLIGRNIRLHANTIWLAAKERLRGAFISERDRWALWLPVGLGSGIAVYFSLSEEPPIWLGLATVAAATFLAFLIRRHPGLFIGLLGVACIALGFSVAQWRTMMVASPMLETRLAPTWVTGRIVAVEARPKGVRVTLEALIIDRLDQAHTPLRARIVLSGNQQVLRPGHHIRVRAILSPPSPPAALGAFDFQRQSYFRGLGAVGFSLGAAKLTENDQSEEPGGFWLAIARLRQKITQSVLQQIDGLTGTVAAALMTGERGAIPPRLMTAIRDSGLAHLLAISGLHIGLVAGILFVGLRAGMALIPRLALRYPIKKWAAAIAILGALGYALIAGTTIPTQRAFMMIGLVFLAVLLDRRGLSMRLVAWAAIAILLFRPEALLGASFQLSFAAVAALIAVYESEFARRAFGAGRAPSLYRTAWLYVGGVALTTMIASTATAPFALYHFNRLAVYGLAANLVAVPVTALWIMPWAVVAFALMPFGVEFIALTPMEWGVDIIIDVAQIVAAWPGAVNVLPAMPTWGMALVALGGVWLCLWRQPWRKWGVIGVVLGLVSIVLTDTPDVLIDGRGKLVAVRTTTGELAFSTLRAERFSRDVWLRRAGLVTPEAWPTDGPSTDGRLMCDSLGCIYRARGKIAALVHRPGALAEDCQIADIVISTVPVRGRCAAPTVIDRFDLWREGGHGIWLEETGIRVESVAHSRGRRPWVMRKDKPKAP